MSPSITLGASYLKGDIHYTIIINRGLLALWGYMSDTLSIDPGPVWERIKDVVIKTVIRLIK